MLCREVHVLNMWIYIIVTRAEWRMKRSEPMADTHLIHHLHFENLNCPLIAFLKVCSEPIFSEWMRLCKTKITPFQWAKQSDIYGPTLTAAGSFRGNQRKLLSPNYKPVGT